MSENLKEFLEEIPLRLNEEATNINVLKKAKTFSYGWSFISGDSIR